MDHTGDLTPTRLRNDRALSPRPVLAVVAIIAIGAILAGLASREVRRLRTIEQRHALEVSAEAVADMIDQQVTNAEQTLLSVRGLYRIDEQLLERAESVVDHRYDIALYDGPRTAADLVRTTTREVSQGRDVIERAVVVGDSVWTLVLTGRTSSSAADVGSPAAVFAFGLLMTMLTAVLVYVIGRQRHRIRRQVADITKDLRESEASLQVMANAVPVGIFDIDLDTGETFLNRTLDDEHGGPWPVWPDSETAHVHDQIEDAALRGEIFVERFEVARDDGGAAWFEVRATGVCEDGTVTRLLGSVADVTADAQLEDRLGDARDTALANARMKSEFLANMSHEIRTPLNGVLGLATLMLDDDLPNKQRERLVTLRQAGQDLLTLLNDILDFSKIEAGRLRLEQVPFSLRAVVEQVTALHASAAHDKNLELRHRIDPALGPVVGDPARLRQVLQNLVGNALKFTADGYVEVTVDLLDQDAAGQRVRIAVADTGIGIAPEMQSAVMTAFTQADASTTRLYGGSGLGLAICRELIDLMGGRLSVTSAVGEGSTFSFEIELDGAEAGSELSIDLPPTPIADSESLSPPASDATVLLAEDNPVNQLVAVGMLAKLGYRADVASDGLEALELIEQRSYTFVLMDCQMPRLDGYETSAHIRALDGDARHTPIIAMTAAAMRGDKERCFAAGMDDYVSKPVSVEALSDAILRMRSRTPDGDGLVLGDTSPAADGGLDESIVRQLQNMPVGDISLFDKVAATFLRNLAAALDELPSLVDTRDWSGVGRLVHKLRGGAATVGATTFVVACTQLEAHIADETVPREAERHLARVRREAATLATALRARMERRIPVSAPTS